MKIKKAIFTAFSSIACISHAQAPGIPVEPNKLFTNLPVNVRAPNSEGWAILEKDDRLIVFAKEIASKDDAYLARVQVFPLSDEGESEDISIPQNFINFVKNYSTQKYGRIFSNKADITYRYSQNLGYPCVDVRIIDDSKEMAHKFQVIGAVCRHPTQKSLAFSASLIHQGKSLDNEIEAIAKNFLSGVTVPR